MAKNAVQSAQLLPTFTKVLSKAEINSLVTTSVEQVIEQGNVLAAAELLSVMDEFITKFRKDPMFIDYVRTELEKYRGKFQAASGTKIEICEAATKYDFSSNGTWKSIMEQIDILTEERKSIEERLRTIPPGKTIIDAETGEMLQGPAKTSTSTYKVYLVKK
ncbi:MAG: hypothetical protein WDN26_04855 [Chitinophagaceae bacterium]